MNSGIIGEKIRKTAIYVNIILLIIVTEKIILHVIIIVSYVMQIFC